MRILLRKCLTTSWSTFNRISYNSSLNSVKMCCTKPIILQSIKKKVDPFCKLLINLPFRVEIKPTDPHEYPDMDTLLIKLFSSDLKSMEKAEIVSVNVTSICDIRAIDPENFSTDISCIIQAPVGCDVDVQTSGEGDVVICDMISSTINVQTEYGNIIASKLQGKEISLSASEGGSITLCKSVQGDIEINAAKDGIVNAEKCLGTRLDVSTESGDINIGSNYCDKATFTTMDGNLLLNNLHMNSSVDIHGKGSLNITCLDGSVCAHLHEGSTKIQVVRITDDSSVQSGGEVFLNVPEDIDAKLTLISGKSLDIDHNITGMYSKDNKQFTSNNISDHEFRVETDEVIKVSRTNWMKSLKLGKRSK